MMRRLLPLLVLPLLWTWAFVLWAYARYDGYARRKGLPTPTGFRRWLAAAWREVRCLLFTQAWQLRFPWAHRPWKVIGPPRGNAVLCVHGFTQNGTNFLRIQKALWRAGRSSRAVLLGFPPRTIEAYAAALERGFDEAFAPGGIAAGGALDVVAHSMGGIVLRVVLARRPDLRRRIHRVVTLGTPHHGTAAARGLRRFPEVRFMGRRSEGLRTLPHLPALLPHAVVVNVGGTADTTVYPLETTLEPGAEHVRLDGLGHAGILVHPTAVAAVMDALSRPIGVERAA